MTNFPTQPAGISQHNKKPYSYLPQPSVGLRHHLRTHGSPLLNLDYHTIDQAHSMRRAKKARAALSSRSHATRTSHNNVKRMRTYAMANPGGSDSVWRANRNLRNSIGATEKKVETADGRQRQAVESSRTDNS